MQDSVQETGVVLEVAVSGEWTGLPASRSEAKRLLRQVGVGYGAILLSCVDKWEEDAARLPAQIRTLSTPLTKGHAISGLLAACGSAWLGTPHMHPPGVLTSVEPSSGWPEVSVQSRAHLQIHHQPARPTGPRKKAFVGQFPIDMGLPESTLLCELLWTYDSHTQSRIIDISFNVPGSLWEPIRVPLEKAARLYLRWSRRNVPWLPVCAEALSGKTLVTPQRITGQQLPMTTVTVVPKRIPLAGQGNS